MIDLKECIKFCIENFTTEEATERIHDYINESLYLKESEIELKYSLNKFNENIKVSLKEITADYLFQNIEAVYSNNCDENGYTIYVDPVLLTNADRDLINRFLEIEKNKHLYRFVFETRKTTCNKFN